METSPTITFSFKIRTCTAQAKNPNFPYGKPLTNHPSKGKAFEVENVAIHILSRKEEKVRPETLILNE
jgi:hypothetical protein